MPRWRRSHQASLCTDKNLNILHPCFSIANKAWHERTGTEVVVVSRPFPLFSFFLKLSSLSIPGPANTRAQDQHTATHQQHFRITRGKIAPRASDTSIDRHRHQRRQQHSDISTATALTEHGIDSRSTYSNTPATVLQHFRVDRITIASRTSDGSITHYGSARQQRISAFRRRLRSTASTDQAMVKETRELTSLARLESSATSCQMRS